MDENDKTEFRGVLPTANAESLAGAISSEEAQYKTAEEFKAAMNDDHSYCYYLGRLYTLLTEQADLVSEALQYLNTDTAGNSFTKNIDAESGDAINLANKPINITNTDKSVEVSGRQAQYMVLAKGRNIRRFNLYNSGIFVVLRAPSLGEVNLVFNQLNEDVDKYGKIFGAAFYMYHDYYIKLILWDFIYSLVLDSNLKKWNKGNRLQKAVSFLDFNLLVLFVGSLMFNRGYPMTHVCTNPKCKHMESIKVDLDELQLTDFSKIPDEFIGLFNQGNEVSLKDTEKYQAVLSKANDSDEVIANYRITRNIPSMFQYLQFGEKFNEQLMMSIGDIKDELQLKSYFVYNYSKLYQVWISSVTYCENGEDVFTTSDSSVFGTVLDSIQESENVNDFRLAMNKYIEESMVTHIAYLASPCVKCQEEPANAVKGLIPFDAQHHFFDQLVMKLV